MIDDSQYATMSSTPSRKVYTWASHNFYFRVSSCQDLPLQHWLNFGWVDQYTILIKEMPMNHISCNENTHLDNLA